MSKWHVSTDVLEARGVQVWEVEANSAEKALSLVRKGEGECVAEEIEVTHCGEPYDADEQKKGGANATAPLDNAQGVR